MNREFIKSISYIYENDTDKQSKLGKRTTDSHSKKIQSSELTGGDGVKISVSRAAVVCLVLLCVLLLTAVIVLCVTFIQERQQVTSLTEERNQLLTNTNFTKEKNQLLTNNKNLTEERDQLLTNNMNLAQEKNQLLTNNKNLAQEKNQLLTNNMNLAQEKNQLLTNNMNLAQEKNQLLTNNMNLAQEKNQLLTNNMNLAQEKNQLLTNNMNLAQEKNQLLTNNRNLAQERDQLKSEKLERQRLLESGWKCHQSSLYFISSEVKNWAESRKYCTDRGADLIIINNREEQDFVNNMSGGDIIWIGLNDIEVEGRWKWVDGSSVTFWFWGSGEPNSYQELNEDCAVNRSSGWADYPWDYLFKWICEKRI